MVRGEAVEEVGIAVAVAPVGVAGEARRADFAAAEDFAGLEDAVLPAEVEADGEAELGFLGGLDHADAFVEVEGEGFFREEVSAAFEDLDDVFVAVHRGCCEYDEIGLEVFQCLAHVVVADIGVGLVHGLGPFQVVVVEVDVADGLGLLLLVHDTGPLFAAGAEADHEGACRIVHEFRRFLSA